MSFNKSDILVAEISGKRPGGESARPTEKFKVSYDHVIISNSSQGYETAWDIVNVPDDYREWYMENVKTSDSAWYAPMNRSYAIKYAREHGYKYLVQLDDNIQSLRIAYKTGSHWKLINEVQRKYYIQYQISATPGMMDDFINAIVTILDCTDCGMSGMSMQGASRPSWQYVTEAYVYSFFALKLSVVPDYFQGDFEDDIEFRLKLAQMGIPAAQAQFLQYGKTAQNRSKDLTGCRGEYAKVGIKRGEHMRMLYGEIYSAGVQDRGHSVGAERCEDYEYFKHKLKPLKIGLRVLDKERMDVCMASLLKKYAAVAPDKVIERMGADEEQSEEDE